MKTISIIIIVLFSLLSCNACSQVTSIKVDSSTAIVTTSTLIIDSPRHILYDGVKYINVASCDSLLFEYMEVIRKLRLEIYKLKNKQ